MQVSIVGAGYVGLVSAACFAEIGTHVICLDHDTAKIASLKQAQSAIYEVGLDELIKNNIAANRLQFSHNFQAHIPQSDIIFICVGTLSQSSAHNDLSQLYQACKQVAEHLQDDTIIVIKSTVPVGTSKHIKTIMQQHNPNAKIEIATNPEFLRAGTAIKDFMHPNRIIIGTATVSAKKTLSELYAPLASNTVILYTDLNSAELIKHASNAFLATKLSFINEIATLCEAVDANIQSVSTGIGLDHRIGDEYLNTGPGFGGSCLAKDSHALVKTAYQHGVSSHIVAAAIKVNTEHVKRMIDKISHIFNNDLAQKKITVFGLTFKPNTDDMRESIALTILPTLLEKGVQLTVYDPQGMQRAKSLLPDKITLTYKDNLYQAAEQTDAILILTDWDLFTSMDLVKIRNNMRGNKMIDLRNLYQPSEIQKLGFDYYYIGMPNIHST